MRCACRRDALRPLCVDSCVQILQLLRVSLTSQTALSRLFGSRIAIRIPPLRKILPYEAIPVMITGSGLWKNVPIKGIHYKGPVDQKVQLQPDPHATLKGQSLSNGSLISCLCKVRAAMANLLLVVVISFWLKMTKLGQ